MNDFQDYGIEKRATRTEAEKLLQLGFAVVFVLAVAVVPSVATIKFFLV